MRRKCRWERGLGRRHLGNWRPGWLRSRERRLERRLDSGHQERRLRQGRATERRGKHRGGGAQLHLSPKPPPEHPPPPPVLASQGKTGGLPPPPQPPPP